MFELVFVSLYSQLWTFRFWKFQSKNSNYPFRPGVFPVCHSTTWHTSLYCLFPVHLYCSYLQYCTHLFCRIFFQIETYTWIAKPFPLFQCTLLLYYTDFKMLLKIIIGKGIILTYYLFLLKFLIRTSVISDIFVTQFLCFWVTWCLTSPKVPFSLQWTSCRRGYTLLQDCIHTRPGVHIWGSSEKWMCNRLVYWGKDTQLAEPVLPVSYSVCGKMVHCRLDSSEVSACSCYRCCVRCHITWWVVACTACRLDTAVVTAHP
jgi:hypothetical protein